MLGPWSISIFDILYINDIAINKQEKYVYMQMILFSGIQSNLAEMETILRDNDL